MFTITKEFKFEAAHKLERHDGKCARLHGHSWKARVILQGVTVRENGPKTGMLIDFGEVKAAVEPLVEQYLDHHYLNETLGCEHPTSEFVAHWLFNRLEVYTFGSLTKLVAVEVDETCTSSCRFEPDNYEARHA